MNRERMGGSGRAGGALAGAALALVFAAVGCSKESTGDGHEHAGESHGHETAEKEHGEEEGGEHLDEVVLSPAAIATEGITLEPVSKRVLQPSFRVPARVAFNTERMAHVGSPVRGRVAELAAKLGDEVEAGAPLLVIDSPDMGEAQSDYLQKRSAAQTAGPAVDLARNAFERGKALHDDGQRLALAEVQRREAELRAAQATLRAAETAEQAAQNRLLMLGMSAEAVERLAATGAIDARFTVRAPIAGQVVEREVTLGELVNPDREALLVLADMDHLWILADVPEGRLDDVRTGAPARVLIGSSDDHWCEGTVSYISPAVDPSTRSVHVRIEANDRHPELRPGVFAQAEIVAVEDDGGAAAQILAVPESAVQLVEGASSVFVAVPGEPGTFARRVVVAGKPIGGFVPIHSGLEEGDEVVVRGAFLLKAELGKGSAEHQH